MLDDRCWSAGDDVTGTSVCVCVGCLVSSLVPPLDTRQPQPPSPGVQEDTSLPVWQGHALPHFSGISDYCARDRVCFKSSSSQSLVRVRSSRCARLSLSLSRLPYN